MALTNEQIDAIADPLERLRLRTERYQRHNHAAADGKLAARAMSHARARTWSELPPPEFAAAEPAPEPTIAQRQQVAPLTLRRLCAIEERLFAKVRTLRELEDEGVEVFEVRQVFEAAREALYRR